MEVFIIVHVAIGFLIGLGVHAWAAASSVGRRRFRIVLAGQVEAMRAQHGRGRHTLWTGDLGVALYLRACIDADDRWPLLDVL